MGLVKKDDASKEVEVDAPEDPPVVKTLKGIDDKYLELEREYEKEVAKLEAEFQAKKQPFLEERKKILTGSEGDGPKTGTPALSGFWLKALQNHQAFAESDTIQEWDEPVLEYLVDIESSLKDETDKSKGFKLVFHFAENPYFTNSELFKEYSTEEMNPYNGELVVKEIKASEIEWKAGKDVTVQKVAKKVKGGGAKKAKQKQEKEEARPSFFREFFRALAPGMPLSQELREGMMGQLDDDDEDEDDDDAMLEYIMDADHDIGLAVRDQIIPFAVRFYTGEAVPDREDDDEDDDDDDEDLDDDDDSEDDDSDDEPRPKGRGKGRGNKTAKKKESGDSAEGGEGKKNAEECKQQ